MKKNQCLLLAALITASAAGAGLKTRQAISGAVSTIYDKLGETTELVAGNASKLFLTPTEKSEVASAPAAAPAVQYASEGGEKQVYTRPAIYVNDLNGAEKWDELTILDANGDAKDYPEQTWHHDSKCQARVWALDVKDIKMDDWLFTPYLELQGGRTYQVKYRARCGMPKWAERLEVMAGTAPTAEAMTIRVCEPFLLNKSVYDEGGAYYNQADTFTAPADGKYMIGFHGCSDPGTYTLILDDIEVAEVIPTDAPNYVTEAAYNNEVNGGLSGTVSFKAPTVNLDSVALTKNIDVKVLRDGTLVKTFENVAPGAECSFVDNVGTLGAVKYTISGWNEAGEGPHVYVDAYIGVNKPKTAENVKLAESGDTGKVTLTWDAVKYDISNFEIPTGQVTYDILKVTSEGLVAVKENLAENSFEYQACSAEEQDLIQLVVRAKTVSGDNEEDGFSVMEFVGKPITNFKESFPNAELTYATMFNPISGNMEGGLVNDTQLNDMHSQDGDNGYAYIGSRAGAGTAGFGFGKTSLAGLTNPCLNFYAYNLVNPDDPTSVDKNTIEVYIFEYGKEGYERIQLGTVDSLGNHKDGWFKVRVPLDNYKNKNIRFTIAASSISYTYNFFDNITVESTFDRDITIARIDAPKYTPTGANYDVEVTLLNQGRTAASGHSVTLYLDGVQYEKKSVSGTLPVNEIQTVNFSVPMHTLRETPVKVHAYATLSRDGNTKNNYSDTIAVNPEISRLASITDLSYEGDMNGVTLKWSEPDYKNGVPEAVVEDFETAEEWAHSFGDWTFIDKDQTVLGGLQGATIPGIIPRSTKGSFFVWNGTRNYGSVMNEKMKPHSGKYQLAALYVDAGDYMTDDWAVSPRLSGKEQTISFWAKSFDIDWLEKISVLYSTGNDPQNTTDFKATSVTGKTIPTSWTEITVTLPEGATYFAVRSNHDENFILFLDDFKFERGYGYGAELKGYNVWLNNEKVNAEPITTTTFTEPKPGYGNEYKVTTVYDLGESASSNAIKLNIGLKNGAGTKENPYTISTVDELNFFFSIADKESCEGVYYKQINDIDLDDAKMALPLAKAQFQGEYDGGGFALKNLNLVSTTGVTYAGLFANIGNKGVVKNLTLEGEADLTELNSAPLAGYCYGTVEGIISKVNVNTTKALVGGIVSEVKSPAVIKDCEYYGKLTSASTQAGGIAGRTNGGTFINCKFKGELANSSPTRSGFSWIGGIAGYAYPSSFINCESDGKMPEDLLGSYRGGIVGFAYGTDANPGKHIYKNCVNKTKLNGISYLGGVMGYLAFTKYGKTNLYKRSAEVDSCVNYGDMYATATTGFTHVGGILGSYTHSTTVKDCDNYGNITSPVPYGMGGIVGLNMETPTDSTQTTFLRCRNFGKVEALNLDNGNSGYVGGIVGTLVENTNVVNCENFGHVSAATLSGGIAGYAFFGPAKVIGCTNYADVDVLTNVAGGIVGFSYDANNVVSNNINFGNVSTASTDGSGYSQSGYSIAGISGYGAGTYENNVNAGDVTGAIYTGGIIGLPTKSLVKVANNLNTGKVIGKIMKDGRVKTSIDSVGAIIGMDIVTDAYWPATAVHENNYYTPNALSPYNNVSADYLANHDGKEISEADLVNTDKLGNGWSVYDKYCWPLPNNTLDSDKTKVWAAQVVAGKEGDVLPKLTGDFYVGCPEGLVWSALPDVITFSENNATVNKGVQKEVVLTATCGEASKQITISLDSPSSVDELNADNIVEEAWYDLNGLRVARPESYDGKVYIVVRLYNDGTTKASKILNIK